MTNFFKKHKLEFIILAVALITRLVFYFLFLVKLGESGFVYGDGEGYLTLVKNFLEYGVFSLFESFPLLPDGFRTPGYPAFIIPFYFLFKNLWSAVLVQNIIGAFSAIFVFLIGKKLFNRQVGFIGSLIFALEPNMAFWSSFLLSETIFIFFLLASIYTFIKFLKNKNIFHIFLSGFLFGLTTLIRPIAQFIPFILILFLFVFYFSRIPLKKIALGILTFIAIFVATIAPWSIRNKIQFDSFNLSWQANVLCGTNTDVYMRFAKKKFPPIAYEELRDYVFLSPTEIIPEITHYNTPKSSYAVCQQLLRVMKSDPIGYTYIYFRNLTPFFLGSGYTTIVNAFMPETDLKVRDYVDGRQTAKFTYFLGGHTGIQAIAFYGGLVLWTSIIILMLIGFVFGLRDKKKVFGVLLFAILIMYFATTSGFGGFSRFRMPVNPFIFLLVAYGVLEILQKYRK